MRSLCLLMAVAFALTIYFTYGAEIKQEPTYIVVAPTKVRPNQQVKVSATILKMEYDTFTVQAIVRQLLPDVGRYDEICSTEHTFTRAGTYDLTMMTRETMSPGNYSLRVAGYSDTKLQGQIFSNDTELFFDTKQVSVFIQLSKPFYRQGQTVRLRVIPVQTNLKPVSTTMDVRIKDANGYTMREFYSQHTNAGGVVSLSYALSSNLLAYGDWTVEVNCREHIYNKTFRVEEFYPPLFYVNVSMPTIMLRNSYGISGLVASNHTTGRGVKGDCTVKLEILTQDNSPGQVIEPLYRTIPYFESRTDFLFTREEMEAVAGGPNALIGKELRVTGSVRDWFFNTTSSGFQSAIVIDEDVEIKFLGGSVWSFKPDVPFNIYIAAVMRDGSPLDPYNENRTIHLDIIETDDVAGDRSRSDLVEISRETSIAEYWLDPKPTTNRISITARYRNKQDTRRELIATRFWSPNEYYIQLSTPTKKPTVGQYMIFNVKTNAFVESILYHIVAHGNIIISDTLQMYSRNKLFSIALSRDMAPSARLIAYFVAPDGQVVVDSLNFHVNGTQLHQMQLRFNRGKDFTYQSIELTALADPLSYVAFSAIEYQLYELGARNGLTWEEVYQELYTYDDHANTSIRHFWYKNGQMTNGFYAPTPSYAHDANSTFFFAGLYVYTDANASAVYTACNKTEGEYPCMDGLTCYDFKEICTYRPECSADHRDEMGCFGNQTYNLKLYNDDALWRSKHIGPYYMDGGFMWQDQFTKFDGRIDFKVPTPTFPTTWVVSGFAMSLEKGLAILPVPARYDGVRPMYITVQGPDYAKVGEQISLRIVVFNFWDESLDVLITLAGSDDYRFAELNFDSQTEIPTSLVEGTHQVLLPVFPGTSRQIYLPFEPRRSGHLAVPITASCLVGGQTVIHHVYIDNYGVKEHWITSRQIDLTAANSEVLPDIYIPTKEFLVDQESRLQNYVPSSPRSRIYVLGDIVGVSFFPYADYDLNAENLLRQPYGSGAEAVFNFAINLQTLKMLRALSTISTDTINKVIFTLNIAMQEMMSYMQKDGSFKEFRWSEKPSTWLTATALQVLTEDKSRVSDLFQQFQIPPDAVSKAAIWLSQQRDNDTGAFHETGDIYNRRFNSTIYYNLTKVLPNGAVVRYMNLPANMSLTALCVQALSQASGYSPEATAHASDAAEQGAVYISQNIGRVTDPFELAISTYALIVMSKDAVNSLIRLNNMRRNTTGGGMLYWSTDDIAPIEVGTTSQDTVLRLKSKQFSNVTAYAVSATSYALLANMNQAFDETTANGMQKFLQEQHMWIGGFASTMDSLMAVRALGKLAERNQDRITYEMTFSFKSDQNETWQRSFTIDQSNWFEQQVVDLPSYWGSIQTTVKGVGKALIQLDTTSFHEHKFQLRAPPGTPAFDLGNYNDQITTRGFNHSHIMYKICPSWLREGRSGMSVLEVGIPSGYIVHNFTLQKYVRNSRDYSNSTIRNAESYRDKAVFYFDYLDATGDINCAEFEAIRWFPVANISEQHFLKVFEYYEPGNFMYTLYEKIELKKLTVCLTCGSYQCPYCPHFASGTWVTPNIPVILFAVISLIFINNFHYIPMQNWRNIILTSSDKK